MKRILILSANSDIEHLAMSAIFHESSAHHFTSIESALTQHNHTPFDVILIDPAISHDETPSWDFKQTTRPFTKANPFVQFVVLTSKENIRQAVKAVKNGASDYLTYPIDPKEIRLVFDAMDENRAKNLELDYLRDRFWKKEWLDIIHSRNSDMKMVYENIRSVAPTIATVLLTGETGTGKGLMARLVHWHSQRSEQPFIVVHCGAIPDTLIESELFGHERGSFTGADRKKRGKFELAVGGTIFLDEIGTISPSAQIKLLQVLQDGTFSRVGGEAQLKTDARIIAATNADIKQMVKAGRFRSDLYYRLNVFPIEIPPLRRRLEDLPHIIDVFFANLNTKYGKGIYTLHPAVEEGFYAYEWPGNLRELENILERAYIIEKSDVLTPRNFPQELIAFPAHMDKSAPKGALSLALARQLAIEECECSYLIELLKQTKGKINQSAQKADISPRQFNRLMARYGLNKNDFKA